MSNIIEAPALELKRVTLLLDVRVAATLKLLADKMSNDNHMKMSQGAAMTITMAKDKRFMSIYQQVCDYKDKEAQQ